jgi:hypothetical protein
MEIDNKTSELFLNTFLYIQNDEHVRGPNLCVPV